MTETQRKPLTRRDALAVGATMLSAAALGTTTVPESATVRGEAGSTRKVRIGVVGGGFGAAFQWYLMDHPNTARVLDGGTTSAGRPYFVMDLVKGVATALDNNRGSQSSIVILEPCYGACVASRSRK